MCLPQSAVSLRASHSVFSGVSKAKPELADGGVAGYAYIVLILRVRFLVEKCNDFAIWPCARMSFTSPLGQSSLLLISYLMSLYHCFHR